jgi:serine/threonine protein kinase
MAGATSGAERVGPYEIRERIGEGGMATVWRAWHTGLHRFEALKVPRPGFDNDEYIQRLLVEARIAARLRHPHIVTIHSISEPDSPRPYLAMDLVEGLSLETLLERRGALEASEALDILEQVASALDYAHSQGVIHRDIKPGNILLQERSEQIASSRWNVKVVDFGISRAAEDAGGTRLTKSGMLVGTPEYMSPEQAGSGEAVDFRTDLYSLAVLAYEMVAGRPPFTAGDGVSRMSILVSHVAHPPTPPAAHARDLPSSFNGAILRGLSKKPEERFGSAHEFVAAARAPSPAAPGGPPLSETSVAPLPSLGARRRDTPFDTGIRQVPAGNPALSAPSVVLPGSVSLEANSSDTSRSNPGPVKRAIPVGALAVAGVIALSALAWVVRQRAQETPSSAATPASSPALPTPLVAPTEAAGDSEVENSSSAPISSPSASPAVPVATSAALPQNAERVERVVRVRDVPYQRRSQPVSSLARGASRVVREGRVGQLQVTYDITYRGQKEMARRVVAQKVLLEAQDEIVEVGTRASASSASSAGSRTERRSTSRRARRSRTSGAQERRRTRVSRRRREPSRPVSSRPSAAQRAPRREAPLPP